MFTYGLTERDGWFYTPTFGVYQQVNQDVYCYVSRYIGFYTLQLYKRGTTGLCTLEARSEANPEALLALGEKWLEQYRDFNQEEIVKSPYYIGNPNIMDECWLV